GPNDRVPSDKVAVTLALADKLDTLVGFFAIDEKPTGSGDPYALRRAALGVIRVALEPPLRLPVSQIFENAWVRISESTHRNSARGARPIGTAPIGDIGITQISSALETSVNLLSFFADRLKVALREKGVRHDLIDAVFALGNEDDLVRLVRRVEALQAFLKTDDGANLLVGYRRAANILKIE